MSSNVSENQSANGASASKVLTKDEILSVARIFAKDLSVRVLDYHIDNYSEEKIGFTGSHYSLKIKFQKSNSDSSESVNTFVKSIPIYNADSTDSDLYLPVLKQEKFFVDKIIPEFSHDYKGKKWCPNYYLTTKNAIVIEDLKFNGYQPYEVFYDNPVHLKSTLAAVARFHSCSILAEARLSREVKHPIMLNEYFKNSVSEMMFNPGEKGYWYHCGINLACSLAESLGYNPDKISKVFDRMYDMVKPSKIYQNAICHGDLHPNNVMFIDNLPLHNCLLIDFQTIRYAPMVTDILQLLHINASRQFRDQFEEELIGFYHSELVDTIKMHDPTLEPPTLKSILKALEEYRAFGLIVACIYKPLAILKDNEKLKDPKDIFDFLFGDRFELVSAHMKVNEQYKYVIESAIIELVERA